MNKVLLNILALAVIAAMGFGCAFTDNSAKLADSIELSPLFGEHAVLQRNMPVPVWGSAKPRTRIVVSINGKQAETVANTQGAFVVRLPDLTAGGPYELTLSCPEDGSVLAVKDVYVGEVWLAGGQSNMAWPMANMRDVDLNDPAVADFPQIRYFKVPLTTQPAKVEHVDGEWVVAQPGTIGPCTAIGYYFARQLSEKLQVPVGIVHSNWGGTMAEGWISRQGLMSRPEFSHNLAADVAQNSPNWWRDYEQKYAMDWMFEDHPSVNKKFETAMQTAQAEILNQPLGLESGWADLDCNTADWTPAKVPGYWPETAPEFNVNGSMFFRNEIEIPSGLANKELELHLGAIDKMDTTYFNGVEVGATGELFGEKTWNLLRVYRIPAELVKAGKNVIAVRNTSHMYGAGLTGPAEEMYLAAENWKMPIPADKWLAKMEHNLGKVESTPFPASMYIRGILFENMIRPLLPLAIRGVIWYQGESNAGNPYNYQALMELLISDWRYNFEQPALPFLQVQLAGYGPDGNWPQIREAQRLAAQNSGNLLATAIDLGEENQIHPARKKEVADRLALCALKQAYNQDVVAQGPTVAASNFNGNVVEIKFANAEGGLTTLDKALPGGVTVPEANDLKVEIRGESLLVTAPEGVVITQVNYAWEQWPAAANLCNQAGLPMLPFQIKK